MTLGDGMLHQWRGLNPILQAALEGMLFFLQGLGGRVAGVDESQKGLKFCLDVGGGKVLNGLDSGKTGLLTLGGEYCSIEADFASLILHLLLLNTIPFFVAVCIS